MLWKARYVSINISQAFTPLTTSPLWTQAIAATGNDRMEAVCKNAEFKEPEKDSDTVLLLGATSGAQNAELDEKGSNSAEFTATMLLNPETGQDLDLETFYLTKTTTTSTASTYTRYNYNSASPSAGVAVCIQFTDGTNIINFLLNNCSVTTGGGFKVDADSHAEQEIKVVCAPDDCWKEFT